MRFSEVMAAYDNGFKDGKKVGTREVMTAVRILCEGPEGAATNAVAEDYPELVTHLGNREAAQAKIIKDLVDEYQAAIGEPGYSGTRQDWIHRAHAAEADVTLLRSRINELEFRLRGLEK